MRSVESNSTISSFLGRWQNLNWITKTQRVSHKNNCIEKNELYFIEENVHVLQMKIIKCTWKDKYKRVLVFSPFLSLEQERKEEEKRNLGMRMSTSFLARWISTRRGMASEVGNPRHNSVVRGRWEAANAFKICKELYKRKGISTWNMRTEIACECWKDRGMPKSC